jgi:uncharacterized YccA/Bax inhibitor family protein
MNYRLRTVRDWALRGATFLGVILLAILLALIPVGIVVAWLAIAAKDTLALPVTLWGIVGAFALIVITLMMIGARWRRNWLWDHFFIHVG